MCIAGVFVSPPTSRLTAEDHLDQRLVRFPYVWIQDLVAQVVAPSQRRDSQSPEGSGRRSNSVSHSYSEFSNVCDVDSAGRWRLLELGERAR